MTSCSRIAITCALTALLAPAGIAAAQQGGRQGGQGARGQGGNQGVLGGVGTPNNRNAPPPKPAPRNAAGRAILGGATAADKGVWLPVFGIFDPISPYNTVPFQPWAK